MSKSEQYVVLTGRQAWVVKGLLQGKTQAALADELGVRPQAIGKIVAQLKEKGFRLHAEEVER